MRQGMHGYKRAIKNHDTQELRRYDSCRMLSCRSYDRHVPPRILCALHQLGRSPIRYGQSAHCHIIPAEHHHDVPAAAGNRLCYAVGLDFEAKRMWTYGYSVVIKLLDKIHL